MISAAAQAALLLTSPMPAAQSAVSAQSKQTTPQLAPENFSDDELTSFATASLNVEYLHKKWQPRIAKAQELSQQGVAGREAMAETRRGRGGSPGVSMRSRSGFPAPPAAIVSRPFRQGVMPMRRFAFYGGLFVVTAATLMLQLIQTRILSVVAWYHLAFFVISIAMFGLTAGAVWVYVRRERFTEATLSHDLGYFTAAFAVTAALCRSRCS